MTTCPSIGSLSTNESGVFETGSTRISIRDLFIQGLSQTFVYLLLIVVCHWWIERQRQAQLLSQMCIRKHLRLESIFLHVVTLQCCRVSPLSRRDPLIFHPAHGAISLIVQTFDVFDGWLFGAKQTDVCLITVDAILRNDRSLKPIYIRQHSVISLRAQSSLGCDPIGALHLRTAK